MPLKRRFLFRPTLAPLLGRDCRPAGCRLWAWARARAPSLPSETSRVTVLISLRTLEVRGRTYEIRVGSKNIKYTKLNQVGKDEEKV